jgi:hypothetical protein
MKTLPLTQVEPLLNDTIFPSWYTKELMNDTLTPMLAITTFYSMQLLTYIKVVNNLVWTIICTLQEKDIARP